MVQELTKLTVNAFRKSNDLQTKVTKAYVKQPGDKRIDRNPYNQLVAQKASIILGNLQQKQCQLIFVMREQVRMVDYYNCLMDLMLFFDELVLDQCSTSSIIKP